MSEIQISINKLSKVTHVVYSAYSDADTITNIRTINNNLFKNTLSLINRYCPSTEHITLLQGMKAYGSHLGYHKTPSQESDQRTKEKNFYYDQEDYLKKIEQGYKKLMQNDLPFPLVEISLDNSVTFANGIKSTISNFESNALRT